MIQDWITSLFDTRGFVTPSSVGHWSPVLLIAAKAASYSMAFSLFILTGLLIWLSCLRAVQGSRELARQRPITLLFSALLFWSGCSYLIRAVIFISPLYRLQLVVTVITSACSWLTVWLLLPAVLGIYYQHRSNSDVGPTDQLQDLKASLLRREIERAEILEGLEPQQALKERSDDHAS